MQRLAGFKLDGHGSAGAYVNKTRYSETTRSEHCAGCFERRTCTARLVSRALFVEGRIFHHGSGARSTLHLGGRSGHSHHTARFVAQAISPACFDSRGCDGGGLREAESGREKNATRKSRRSWSTHGPHKDHRGSQRAPQLPDSVQRVAPGVKFRPNFGNNWPIWAESVDSARAPPTVVAIETAQRLRRRPTQRFATVEPAIWLRRRDWRGH